MAINYDKENVIEWFNGQTIISATISQPSYIRKIKKLAQKVPDLVQIRHENKDGSIFVHLSPKVLKLSYKTPRNGAKSDKSDAVTEA